MSKSKILSTYGSQPEIETNVDDMFALQLLSPLDGDSFFQLVFEDKTSFSLSKVELT
jgi:hypothetical protein